MAPVSLWLSAASLALLSSTTTFALSANYEDSADDDDDYDYDNELTSHEKHQLQRNAMDAALQSSPLDTFASVQESRSYYYFHAGVEMAAASAATMSGRDAKELAGGDEDAYLKYIEEAIEAELARVRQQLGEVKDKDESNDTSPGRDVMDVFDVDDEDEEDAEYTAEERLHLIYTGAHSYFECREPSSILQLSDVRSKLNELRTQFWKFAGVDHPTSFDYKPNPHLYLDYTGNEEEEEEEDDEDDNNTKRDIGLFAARDFKKGEVVYSQKTNAVYFQEVPTWIDFLHSVPSDQDACLALELTSMKRVSTPGRLVLELSLDEGGFMRRLKADSADKEEEDEEEDEEEEDEDSEEEEEKEKEEEEEGEESNVEPENAKSFSYLASRDIEKGEEIIQSAPTATET